MKSLTLVASHRQAALLLKQGGWELLGVSIISSLVVVDVFVLLATSSDSIGPNYTAIDGVTMNHEIPTATYLLE